MMRGDANDEEEADDTDVDVSCQRRLVVIQIQSDERVVQQQHKCITIKGSLDIRFDIDVNVERYCFTSVLIMM